MLPGLILGKPVMRTERVRWLTCLVLALSACLGLTGAQPDAREPGKLPVIATPDFSKLQSLAIAAVVDGDTITVTRDGGVTEKVRLLGIDCPETSDPTKGQEFYGVEATTFVTNLLKGERVYVVPEKAGEKDRYGRTLAYVYRAPDGLFVNAEVVRQGYGSVYDAQAFQHIDAFLQYERAAKAAGRGQWDTAAKLDWEHLRQAPGATNPAAAPGTVAPGKDAAPDAQKVTVYVTKSGTKYHRAGCSYLKSSQIPMDLADAKKRYGPCSKCGPPQ